MEKAKSTPTIGMAMKNIASLIVLFLANSFHTKLNAQEGTLNFTHYAKAHGDNGKLRYAFHTDGSLTTGTYSIPNAKEAFKDSTVESLPTDLIKAYESQFAKDAKEAELMEKIDKVDPKALETFLANQGKKS